MALYTQHDNKLQEVKEKPFRLEKEIQKLFEANLTQVMGLELVKSEFTIKNKRIDTLAFDAQSKAFVIVEYKRDKNFSVIDQGFAYLSLMLENKSDFILEYNETQKQTLKRDEVDWSQSKVVFVSTHFTENQIQASNFKDLPIELWEVKQYENGVISIHAIKKSSSAESIKPITKSNKVQEEVIEQIKVYTEQDHFVNGSDMTIELYERFKSAILNLSNDIEVTPKKQRISFRKDNKIFADIGILSKTIKIWINLKKGQLDDPKGLAKDMFGVGHWGNGDYQIQVDDDRDLEYIMSLVKQGLK
jgi:predicted transport protein